MCYCQAGDLQVVLTALSGEPSKPRLGLILDRNEISALIFTGRWIALFRQLEEICIDLYNPV